ncbi:MAG: hypothetical protein RL621_339 [Bacteroidota bacterium]|jgi:hypothetical protein
MYYDIWIQSKSGMVMNTNCWVPKYTWTRYLTNLAYSEAISEMEKISLTSETPQVKVTANDYKFNIVFAAKKYS